MTRPLLLLALAIALVPVAAANEPAGYLPSGELVRLAVQSHPALASARAERDATGFGAEAVRRGPHEFEASVTPQKRRTPEQGRFNEWEAQIGRAVRLPGKAALDARIATQMREGADHGLQGTQRAVGEMLLDSWMAWLGAEHAVQLTSAQQQLLAREREGASLMHAKGALSSLDLDLIDADLASAHARLIGARSEAQAARQRLQAHFPQLPLPERVPVITDPQALGADESALGARLVESNASLAQARSLAAEHALLAERARAERRPDPIIGVRWLREGRDAENALGLVLSVPIGGGYRRAQAQEAGAREAAAHAQAAGSERDAQLQAWDTLHQARALQARWQAEQAALAAHRSAAERGRRAWELGELGMAEYLLAERALIDRQLAEQQARVAAATAMLRLQVRSGQLWQGPETGAGN